MKQFELIFSPFPPTIYSGLLLLLLCRATRSLPRLPLASHQLLRKPSINLFTPTAVLIALPFLPVARSLPFLPRRCPGFKFAGVRLWIPWMRLGPRRVCGAFLASCQLYVAELFEHIPVLIPLALLASASSVTPSAHLQKSLLIS